MDYNFILSCKCKFKVECVRVRACGRFGVHPVANVSVFVRDRGVRMCLRMCASACEMCGCVCVFDPDPGLSIQHRIYIFVCELVMQWVHTT